MMLNRQSDVQEPPRLGEDLRLPTCLSGDRYHPWRAALGSTRC